MSLNKGISFWGVFGLATGAMISSGIFILPGMAYAKTGPAVVVSYFLAGILALLGVMSVIELSTAMPKAGGDYYFINRAFGPMLGTLSGFLGWFALSLKSAFAIFGISEVLFLFTRIPIAISSLFLCLLFILMNIRGVKEAAVFQIIMVAGLLLIMLGYIIVGFPKINPTNFTPFMKSGINEVAATSGFIFISFGGLLKVANVSEEVINPKRNIPLGMISSITIVTALYTLIVYILVGTLSPEFFAESLTPVADSARLLIGNPGYYLIICASLLAFITTANAGLMAASRYPLALSRDNLLPRKIAAVHKKRETPAVAIFITGILIYLSLLLPLEILVKAASTVILTSYVLTNISVIMFRESRLSNYRPSFKAPLYPWLQLFSIAVFTFFIVDMGSNAMEISLAFLFLSFCIYFFYGRKQPRGESALLHLLKRIADKRLTRDLLEDELREIVIHRDNIEQDGFDELIKTSRITDLPKKMSFEKMLTAAADDIAEETGMAPEEIIRRYQQRQDEISTVISEFLAIPHIVVDGENILFLKIIRCKEGLEFSSEENNVKAVFLLGGTKEKRDLHLKTIASIATLVSQKDFQREWLEARNTAEIKNLLLLNNRKRFQ